MCWQRPPTRQLSCRLDDDQTDVTRPLTKRLANRTAPASSVPGSAGLHSAVPNKVTKACATAASTDVSGSEWMTESQVLARTGLSLRTHQQRTVGNYLRLCDLAPELPIIPCLQGQSVADFHRCADLYERHGIDLAS